MDGKFFPNNSRRQNRRCRSGARRVRLENLDADSGARASTGWQPHGNTGRGRRMPSKDGHYRGTTRTS